MKVNVPFEIDLVEIAYLLSSAFEGGSNYWYLIDFDKSVNPDDDKLWKFPKDNILSDDKEPVVYKHVQWPLSEGGRLFVTNVFDDEDEHGFLDLDSIKKGLTAMAVQYPRHWKDFVSEKPGFVLSLPRTSGLRFSRPPSWLAGNVFLHNIIEQ